MRAAKGQLEAFMRGQKGSSTPVEELLDLYMNTAIFFAELTHFNKKTELIEGEAIETNRKWRIS